MTTRLSGLSSFYLFQRALSSRNADIFKSSEQLSTQKRINRPSDDPEGARTVLSYRSALDRIDQYKANISTGQQMLKHAEITLSSAKDLIDQAKQLALQGNNSTLGTDGRLAIAEQIKQISQQLLGYANTEINGQYLFSGFKSDTKPFSLDSNFPNPSTATYAGDTNLKSLEIAEGQTVQIQIRGDVAFMGDGGANTVDLFKVLGDLESTLRTPINPAATVGDPDHFDTISAAMGDAIEGLDKGFNQVLREITGLGGKQNRLQSTLDDFGIQTETLKTFVSDIEDKDIADASLEFQRAQLALQATLGSASAVLGLPSLMDFIGK